MNKNLKSKIDEEKIKLGNKIKLLRKSKKITQLELAEMTGYNSRVAISDIENGKNAIPSNKLELFAKALNVNKSELVSEKPTLPTSNIQKLEAEFVKIPLFNSISAGYGAIIDNTYIDDFDVEYELLPSFYGWENCFAVRVKGDSMAPEIPDGAIAIINVNLPIENNQIGAFSVYDASFLKRKKILNNTILLVSNNSDYEPIIVTKNTEYREIGKLIQVNIKY